MLHHTSQTMTSPRRLVVVGGSGFIGSHVVKQARSRGWEAVTLGSADVDLLDPSSPSRMASLLNPSDTVVFASAKAPAKTNADVVANAILAMHFCQAIETVGVDHLIVLSSDAVYGDASGMISESSPVNPDSLHGTMSLVREQMCLSLGLPATCIVRATNVYGQGDPHNSYGANRFARQAMDNGDIKIFGLGQAVRDHVSVEDVAVFVNNCVGRRSTGVINAVSGSSCSFAELAHAMTSVSPDRFTVSSVGSESAPTFRQYDPTERMRTFPGFTPTRPTAGAPRLLAGLLA